MSERGDGYVCQHGDGVGLGKIFEKSAGLGLSWG